MRNIYIVLTISGVLFGAGPASAGPGLRGYSGLLLCPTTDALSARQYNVGVATTEFEDWDERAYVANFGLQDGLEAGIYWWRPQSGSSETLLNLKYRFQPATPGRASLAVGVSDITDEIETAVYFVASKEIGRPVGTIGGRPVSMLRLHGGIGGGWLEDFFFGAEARLSNRLTVMAEHVNDRLNVGARVHLWRNFTVNAGLLDTNDWAFTLSYDYPLQGGGPPLPATVAGGGEPITAPTAVSPKPLKPSPAPAEAAEEPAAPAAMPVAVEAKPAKEEGQAAPPAETTAPEPIEPPKQIAKAPATPSEEEPAPAAVPPEVVAKLPSPEVKEEAKKPAINADKPVVDIKLRDLYPDSAVTKEGKIFVPVRPIADWLGLRTVAKFTPQGLKVTVSSETSSTAFHIGASTAMLDDQEIELPAAPYLLQSKTTMVPVEFFGLLGVPIQIDAVGGVVLFERDDAVGRVKFGK